MLNLFVFFCQASFQPYSSRVGTSVITGHINECIRHFSATSELFQRFAAVDLPRTHFAPRITPKKLFSKSHQQAVRQIRLPHLVYQREIFWSKN